MEENNLIGKTFVSEIFQTLGCFNRHRLDKKPDSNIHLRNDDKLIILGVVKREGIDCYNIDFKGRNNEHDGRLYHVPISNFENIKVRQLD